MQPIILCYIYIIIYLFRKQVRLILQVFCSYILYCIVKLWFVLVREVRRLEDSEGPVYIYIYIYICILVDVAVGGIERSGRSDRLLSSLLSSVFLKGESQVSSSCLSRGGRYVDSALSDRRTLMKCVLLHYLPSQKVCPKLFGEFNVKQKDYPIQ